MEVQAAILRAIIDQPKLVSARAIAGVASSSEQAARMMKRDRNTRGPITNERRNAAETMLTMCSPSLDRIRGDVLSMHQRA